MCLVCYNNVVAHYQLSSKAVYVYGPPCMLQLVSVVKVALGGSYILESGCRSSAMTDAKPPGAPQYLVSIRPSRLQMHSDTHTQLLKHKKWN